MVAITEDGRRWRSTFWIYWWLGPRSTCWSSSLRCSSIRRYSIIAVLPERFPRGWGDTSERITGLLRIAVPMAESTLTDLLLLLQSRPGSKVLPAPYVKVYLVAGKKCIAKAKTTAARKTLDPLYQQMLSFREPFQGCILQVSNSPAVVCPRLY